MHFEFPFGVQVLDIYDAIRRELSFAVRSVHGSKIYLIRISSKHASHLSLNRSRVLSSAVVLDDLYFLDYWERDILASLYCSLCENNFIFSDVLIKSALSFFLASIM